MRHGYAPPYMRARAHTHARACPCAHVGIYLFYVIIDFFILETGQALKSLDFSPRHGNVVRCYVTAEAESQPIDNTQKPHNISRRSAGTLGRRRGSLGLECHGLGASPGSGAHAKRPHPAVQCLTPSAPKLTLDFLPLTGISCENEQRKLTRDPGGCGNPRRTW